MKIHKLMPHSEKGQGLVEFAVGATVLLILLVGVMDLGRALFTFIALRDAAQEGATYGSLYPDQTSAIETRARGTSHSPVDLSDPSKVQVQIQVIGPACAGSAIQVDVIYPNFDLTTPLLATIIGSDSIPIHARITDTILTPPCH